MSWASCHRIEHWKPPTIYNYAENWFSICQQPSITTIFQVCRGLVIPSKINAKMWMGLKSYNSYVGNWNYCYFMHIIFIISPKDTVFATMLPKVFLLNNLFASSSYIFSEPWGMWCNVDTPYMAEHFTDTYFLYFQ